MYVWIPSGAGLVLADRSAAHTLRASDLAFQIPHAFSMFAYFICENNLTNVCERGVEYVLRDLRSRSE